MRRNIEDIEIQDPPLEELKKKSSCVKSTCFTGFGCVAVFIIGSLILLKFSEWPKTTELKTVPENFPESIPIYSKDDIDLVKFTSGAEQSRARQLVALAPKVLLYPLLSEKRSLPQIFNWQNFREYLKRPATDHRDQTIIEWRDLAAEPKFIERYYQSELKKNGYTVTNTSKQENNFEFIFNHEATEGIFSIADDPNKKGTDYLIITIKTPIK